MHEKFGLLCKVTNSFGQRKLKRYYIRVYSQLLLQRDPLHRMFNKNKNLRPFIKSDFQPEEGVQNQGGHTSFLLKHNQEMADLGHMAT